MSKQNVNQINYCLSHILIASFTKNMGINLLFKKCESNKALFVIHLIASFTSKMGINLLVKKCEPHKALFATHLMASFPNKLGIFFSKQIV